MSDLVHSCWLTDAECAGGYGLSPEEARFFCHGCERWCAYCCGCLDDMPELCDYCWHHVTKRREEARRCAP